MERAVATLTRLLGQPPAEQNESDHDAEAAALEELAMALAGENGQLTDRPVDGWNGGADESDPERAERLRAVFRGLVANRLLKREYTLDPAEPGAAPPGSALRILQCTRLLLRDRWYIKELVGFDGAVNALANKYKVYAERHFSPAEVRPGNPRPSTTSAEDLAPAELTPPAAADATTCDFHAEILSELASIFKKLASDRTACPWRLLVRCDVHRTAVSLLSTRDPSLLASALVTLCTHAAASDKCAALIARLDCADQLLLMLREYGAPFKHLAADLLQLLCRLKEARREVHRLGGVTVVTSLLHVPDGDVLEALLRVMNGLLSERAAAAEMRAVGGVPILVSMLVGAGEGMQARGRGSIPGRIVGAIGGRPNAAHAPAVMCLVCSALTKLAIEDEGGSQIRQCNGVYLLGRLLTDTHDAAGEGKSAPGAAVAKNSGGDGSAAGGLLLLGEVQAHAFRAMRFVFSVERNRKVFKRLFPPALFAAFIDVGHYKQDVGVYRVLAQQWRGLSREAVKGTAEALEDINQGSGGVKETRVIRDWVVTELLGSGAFGSVYRVHKKRSAETVCAMKELNPAVDKDRFGTTPEEVSLSVGRVASEVEILSRLEHPNIVNYYESFTLNNGLLYIVMELVEGASLLDLINSSAEKKQRMTEESVWEIFLQVVLALHYIHVEKGVVHRDITPSNILVEHDTRRVKLVDFGLAKADPGAGGGGARGRRHTAVMQSAVGTMPYSCPEIIMHEPYGPKADVWSLGCVLYHMLALRAPFDCSNMLMMASAIVEGRYPSLEHLIKKNSNGKLGNASNGKEGEQVSAATNGSARKQGSAGSSGGEVSPAVLGRRDSRSQFDVFYSQAIVGLVGRLLTTDPEKRPSTSEVAAACSPYLMRSMDRLQADTDKLKVEMKRERRKRVMEGSLEQRKHEALRRLQGLGLEDGGSSPQGFDSPRGAEELSLLNGIPRAGGVAGGGTTDGVHLQRSASLEPPGNTLGSMGGSGVSRLGSSLPPIGGVGAVSPAGTMHGNRPRGGNTFKINQERLRPIADPLSQILAAMHKLVFVDQLPPGLRRDPRRGAVQRYKRHLFAATQNAGAIKAEMVKLLAGTREEVTVPGVSLPPDAAHGGWHAGVGDRDSERPLTYEDLGRVVEELLLEHGFYSTG